jgi:acyl dehydratase
MRGRYLEDYTIGEIFETPGRTITETDVVMFAGLSGDYNELHTNKDFMAKSDFGQRLVHGLLGLSISVGLFFRTGLMEGTVIAFLGMEEWKFTGPILFNDTIHARLTVIDVKPSKSKADRGVLKLSLETINQKDEVVQTGVMALMVSKKPA